MHLQHLPKEERKEAELDFAFKVLGLIPIADQPGQYESACSRKRTVVSQEERKI